MPAMIALSAMPTLIALSVIPAMIVLSAMPALKALSVMPALKASSLDYEEVCQGYINKNTYKPIFLPQKANLVSLFIK